MWEWDVRVLDIQDGSKATSYAPICVGGRGAAPPEFCGGPTGYRFEILNVAVPSGIEGTRRLRVDAGDVAPFP